MRRACAELLTYDALSVQSTYAVYCDRSLPQLV